MRHLALVAALASAGLAASAGAQGQVRQEAVRQSRADVADAPYRGTRIIRRGGYAYRVTVVPIYRYRPAPQTPRRPASIPAAPRWNHPYARAADWGQGYRTLPPAQRIEPPDDARFTPTPYPAYDGTTYYRRPPHGSYPAAMRPAAHTANAPAHAGDSCRTPIGTCPIGQVAPIGLICICGTPDGKVYGTVAGP